MDSFTTSFGRKIDFIPGYRQSHRRPWKFKFSEAGAPLRLKRRTGTQDIFGSMFSYGMMADFLTRLGLWSGRSYRRSLDVGGAQGVISCLLRAEGKARHTTTVDIVDYSALFSAPVYLLYYLKYRLEVLASRLLPLPRKLDVMRKNTNKYGYGTTFASHVWNVRFRRMPGIDRYVAGDFATSDLGAKFDLVVSINAIEYFDYPRLFARVSELLEDGGVFAFLVNYWWYPVNATTIYGDFPYACQRLTREDLRRYFEENYPDQAAAMERQYGYFHQGSHPVVADYVAAADRHGLSLAGSERLMPRPDSRDHRTPFVPAELNAHDDGRLSPVLEDIHRFRPDVTLEDLYTSHVLMAFVKRPRAAGSVAGRGRP